MPDPLDHVLPNSSIPPCPAAPQGRLSGTASLLQPETDRPSPAKLVASMGDDGGFKDDAGGKKVDGGPDQAGDKPGETKPPGEKGGKGLYIGLGVGGLLLLSCCCCGGGGGGGYWWYSSSSKPAIAGKWIEEALPPRFLVELNNDNTGRYGEVLEFGGLKDANMKWTLVDDKTLELKLNDAKKDLWVKSNSARFTIALSGDQLTLTHVAGDKSTTKLRKFVDEKKGK
jgi:hypothetical protein